MDPSSQPQFVLPEPPQDSISCVKFIPESPELLVCSSWDGFMRIYNVDKTECIHTSEDNHPLLSCSATESRVYYGGLDCSVYSFDLGSQSSRKIGEHMDAVRCMEYSKSEGVLVTGSWDASLMIWDERSLTCVGNIPQVNEVFCMDVRDELVVVGTANKLISIWDLRNTKSFISERKSKLSAHQTRTLKIFPDKKKFALGSVEGRVAIDPVHENEPDFVGYAFKPHVDKQDGIGHPVNAISIHSPTTHFVTGASDKRAYLWDVERKRRIMELGCFPSSIAAMDFSDDGSKLAIACSYTHDLVSPPDPMPPNRIYIRPAKFPSKTKSKLQWLAYLEFSHSRDEVQELSWDSIPIKLPLTQKLYDMMKNGGIPHSLRPQLWLRLSGALEKKSNPVNLPYWKVVKESTKNEYFSFAKHIEKDLTRILPTNGCFSKLDSPGTSRLRRVLRAIAWLYPDIGYCQGMGTVLAHLLLFMEEEDVFWLMTTIIEDLLPASYFTSDFGGIRVDSLVLAKLVSSYFPKVHALLKEHDIELGLIVLTWFLTLFASVVHVKMLLRIWDLFFAEGDIIIFKVMLALIKLKDDELLQLKNSAEIFNFLSDLPAALDDFDRLSLDKYDDLSKNTLETERKQAASTNASSPDSSMFSSTKYRRVKKRDTRKPGKAGKANVLKSFFGESRGPEDMKNKNVRQTELMVDLHEAILQIGRHFISCDPKFMKVDLEPDFSLESHSKDHERFSQGFIVGVKRAKALVDFERRDDDELGFRKNDIITVVNSKDEHCWVGELNGLRGWFPAKFVSILDERSKQYSAAGDDSVTEGIADLVRGSLCPAMKRIFENGMKKPTSLAGPVHPWLFIEEVALKEIERDFKSVYSRLVLCKTYRLDEDGKVLSPEELLYRCVELVNRSHEKIQMDVKLRSLICLGLNEQVLHLWIEIFCSSAEVVNKWYHPWSFLNSPGWIGLKCELRLLSQFSFTLSLEWELRALKEEKLEVKSGVRDMLVKHHLFSWNL